MFGVNPQMLAAAREIGSSVKGQIIVDYAEDSITLKMSGESPQAQQGIAFIMDQFPMAFAQQLSTFFGITGQLVKRNEASKKPVSGQQ